ncbi:MAG: hypothetical protein R3C52_10375 [Hyphomonadaceae bacterium]
MTVHAARDRDDASPLVQRYVAAVARHLDRDAAGDILAELREAITSRLDALEEEHGVPPSESAIGEVLKSFGPPMVVATRYAKRDRLIGPDLYPFFWPTAKALVGLFAAMSVVIAAYAAVSSGQWMSFPFRAIHVFMSVLLPGLGVMLAVFVALDRTDAGAKIAASWDPKSLPQDHIRKPRPLFDSLVGLGFDVLFVLWWSKAVDFPALMDREPSVVLNVEAWAPWHGAILALACVSAAIHLYDLVHPGWSRLRAVIAIAAFGAGTWVLAALAREPLLFVANVGEDAAQLAQTINMNVGIVLWVAVCGLVIGAGIEVWRLARFYSGPAGNGLAGVIR